MKKNNNGIKKENLSGIPQKSLVALREEAILKFWEENKIFAKSVEQRSTSKEFVFYEGPPTANGQPGIHHVLARSFKDIICRYKTMQGFRVERKAGWDTHGLPVELQVEKELKISSKPEIEKYGIEEFNKKCKASVWEYKDEWERMTKRIAFWLDLEHSYVTYSNEYIESVWWILSEIYKKGLLYEGYKVVPYCSRCGTGLSSHEVAQGYKKIKDNSIYVKFKLKYRAGKTGRGVGALIYNDKDEILLVNRNEKGRRTTWALPGGKVEQNETFRESLEREVVEELGVTVESAEPFSAKPDIFEGRIYETVCYKVKIKGEPKIMVKGELDKLKWFSLDNLPEIDYPPSRDAINTYKKNENTFHVSVDNSSPLVSVYALVWTTTPWTLPGNVALAINESIKYAMIKEGNDFYVLAKDRIEQVFGNKEYEIISEVKGKDLLGIEYEQLFGFVKPSKPAFRVVIGDFVTTQDGSGIVHIAPAFGEDDMDVAKENDLPVLMTVNLQGKFIPEITPWSGKYVAREETNKEIISELKKRNLLFKEEIIDHDYPFCWRCDTKLIYYAKKSWFIKMTDPEIKKALIENNEKINWIPEHIKEGRFGEWLREVKDWALSRERYWGTPLPIWKCQMGKSQIPPKESLHDPMGQANPKSQTNPKSQIQNCGNIKFISSIAELEKISGKKLKDLHRPFIDEVSFKCEKCAHSTGSGQGGIMKRVPDVIDCWFDSGAMPFAQWHWPFAPASAKASVGKQNQKPFPPELFPADFISEAIDQTRGWFYTLLAISTLLDFGAPYKNVVTYGHVLDAKGKKMSKSKGNVVDPWEVADKYGIDVLRWYFYTVGGPGEPKRFDFKDLGEAQNKFYRTYWNSYQFFKTYGKGKNLPVKAKALNLLDKWIVSRLNETILETTELLDNYDVIRSARLIEGFVDELSNWYIRRSRDRMRTEESAAVWTLSAALNELTKLTAPFVPFVSEEIYCDINTGDCPESVHLSDWPKADEKLIDKKLNEEMEFVREIVTLGLALRSKAKIKVRQPIASLKIKNQKSKIKIKVKLLDLIKDELNVKKIIVVGKIKEQKNWVLKTNGEIIIALDTKITDELKEEGAVRDIVRHIQTMRKDLGLTKENKIEVYCGTDETTEKIIKKWKKYIKEKTITKSFDRHKEGGEYDLVKEIETEGGRFKFAIKKIK